MPGETPQVGRGRERLEAGRRCPSYANNLPRGILHILILSIFCLTSWAFDTGSKRLSQVCRGRGMGLGVRRGKTGCPLWVPGPLCWSSPSASGPPQAACFCFSLPVCNLLHPSPMSTVTGLDSVSLLILEFFKGVGSLSSSWLCNQAFLLLPSPLAPHPLQSPFPTRERPREVKFTNT